MTASHEQLRLFVQVPLSAGAQITLDQDQSHYLRNVMRRQPGDRVGLFNGTDGEWRAIIDTVGKRSTKLHVTDRIQAQWYNTDLWLLFAPVKRARIDYIAAKATELGVAEIHPVLTDHTNVSRVNCARLHANAVEAAEQCGLVSVPEVHSPVPLGALLDNWPGTRRIMYCDETGNGPPAVDALRQATGKTAEKQTPWAVLIGPEGGFSKAEQDRLRVMPQALAVSLGPRIMRADTAAVCALAVWQSVLGDWDRAGRFHSPDDTPHPDK